MNKLDIILLKFFMYRSKSDTVRLFYDNLKERNESTELFKKSGYIVKYIGRHSRDSPYSGIEISYVDSENKQITKS